MEPDQIAALTSLARWSEWLISVGLALLAAVATITQGSILKPEHPKLVKLSALFFILSIFAATALLGAVPDAMQKVPIGIKEGDAPELPDANAKVPLKVDENALFSAGIYSYEQFGLVPLWITCTVQHGTFTIGVVILVLGVIGKSFGRSKPMISNPAESKPMISNPTEYEKAREELHFLEERLEHLQQAQPLGAEGFTKAGIRKKIARLHEELALYEGSEEARQGTPQ